MDDQELGAFGRGELEQLGLRGDARGERLHSRLARNLKAVGTVVLKARGFENAVDLLKDVRDVRGHQAKIAGRECGILASASGRGAAW